MNYAAFEFQARSVGDLLRNVERGGSYVRDKKIEKNEGVSRKTKAWKHNNVDPRKNRKNRETPNKAINLI
jgi:hypothetical protein